MIGVTTHIAGRYRVDSRLGGGGMADVFDAYDEVLDRPVAVKLLRGIDDAAAARRFAEEIRLTARVNHPNIVRLFNAGEHDGSPFLVLERVTGGTLAGEMAAGPLDSRRVATIGEQLASALSHSHAAGIVHRDVKPTNVLLTQDGDVRLADFGIAITATATRLTVTGTVAGSAGYVSPEQVLGTGAGAPSDVYSLGLVLLECLVGAPPWSGTTVEVALARLATDPHIPDSLPKGWAPLLRAMTARRPEDRPPIEMVGLALSHLAAGEPVDPRMFAPPGGAVVTDRRVPAVAAMSTLLLLFSALLVLSSTPTPTAIASGPSLSNFAAASQQISAIAAERAALTAAAAAADAAPKVAVEERRVGAQRTRGRRDRNVDAATSGDSVATAETTSAPPAPSAPSTSSTPSLSTTLSDTRERIRSTTDDTDVTSKVVEPVKDLSTTPEELDPIETVKDAAHTLNKGKPEVAPGKLDLPGKAKKDR